MSDQDRPEERLPHGADESPTERIEAPAEWAESPTKRIERPAEDVAPPTQQIPAPAHHQQPGYPLEPERARGPHAPTILMALVCLAVAALAIARQVTGFVGLTWSGSGPAVIVGAGVVLLAVGVLGLVRDRRDPGQR